MTKPMVFSISNQLLIMNGKAYSAVSGPYGDGALPVGEYDVEILVDLDVNAVHEGFICRNAIADFAFWIKLTPRQETDRTGLGIHPDGNIPGTLGCIGTQGFDTIRFYIDYSTIKVKPTRLIAVD